MTDDEPRWEGFASDDDHLRLHRRAVLDELIREIGNEHARSCRACFPMGAEAREMTTLPTEPMFSRREHDRRTAQSDVL